jgi:hypothetical protein
VHRRFFTRASELERERQHDIACFAYRLRQRGIATAFIANGSVGWRVEIGEQDVDADRPSTGPVKHADELRQLGTRHRPPSESCNGGVVDHHDDRFGPGRPWSPRPHLRVETDELEAAQPWHVERDEVRAGERQHDAQGETAKLQVARPPAREGAS